MRPDFLRWATPTPLTAAFSFMDCTVRLETDSVAVRDRVCCALTERNATENARHDFLWRLVAEPDSGSGILPEAISWSDGELSLISIGQRSFVALDAHARHAIGFIEESLCKDGFQLENLLLRKLIELTARALAPRPPRREAYESEWFNPDRS